MARTYAGLKNPDEHFFFISIASAPWMVYILIHSEEAFH